MRAGRGTPGPGKQRSRPPLTTVEGTSKTSWTCNRCQVIATWSAESGEARRPDNWTQEGEEFFCLGCRRARAGEAGLEEALSGETTFGERSKVRAAAMIDFEVQRDPDRANGQIAKACRTSVPAVVKSRRRLGLDERPPPR